MGKSSTAEYEESLWRNSQRTTEEMKDDRREITYEGTDSFKKTKEIKNA